MLYERAAASPPVETSAKDRTKTEQEIGSNREEKIKRRFQDMHLTVMRTPASMSA